jgi:LysM repeat protein
MFQPTAGDAQALVIETAALVQEVSSLGKIEVFQKTSSLPKTYQLHKGEFPYCIARRFNLDPNELLRLNGLNRNSFVYPGQVLTLPQSGRNFPVDRALHLHQSYLVRPGDTIYTVACFFGDIDPLQLVRANALSEPYTLSSGQVLIIPEAWPAIFEPAASSADLLITATNTIAVEPTLTASPELKIEVTAEPTDTSTAAPPAIPTLEPTATQTTLPTAMPTVEPTATFTPEPTYTSTKEIKPSSTAVPSTATPVPITQMEPVKPVAPSATPLPPTQIPTAVPSANPAPEDKNWLQVFLQAVGRFFTELFGGEPADDAVTSTEKPAAQAVLPTFTSLQTSTYTPVPTNTHTLVPTITYTPEPTHTPTQTPVPVLVIDPEKGQKSLPQDILPEIAIAGVGGGGGGPCYDPSSVKPFPDYSIERFSNDEGFFPNHERYGVPYLNSWYQITICSPDYDESVSATLHFPDGQVNKYSARPQQNRSSLYYNTIFLFFVGLDKPEGKYQLHLEGTSGRYLEYEFTLFKPEDPRVRYMDSSHGLDHFMLYGFKPYEQVKLFIYKDNSEEESPGNRYAFQGWQTVQTDQYGTLFVDIINPEPETRPYSYQFDPMLEITNFNLFAIGDASGVAKTFPDRYYLAPFYSPR